MEQESDEKELIVEIVCSGPPYCDLDDEKVVTAQRAGCVWCSKIYTEPDGREILEQPGEA